MATFIKIDNEVDTLGSSLLCPHCGGNNLHQKDVETEAAAQGFPAADAILINFYCENCPSEPVLSIQQYKGTTYIGWHSMRVIL